MADAPSIRLAHDRSMFLNCPFGALVFAILDCGYRPRCALEIDDAGDVRLEKIVRIVRGCRRGIHDISRTELDEVDNLPRFDMPFELGLRAAEMTFTDHTHIVSTWLSSQPR